jgi:Fur family peroxide stress response transcriptional regulator
MEKYSKQREEIFNCIKIAKNHPTAEDIYMNLKLKNPNISRGTVYRNLNLLVEKGLVNKISNSGKPDKFDYVCHQHSHAICKNCGEVFDCQVLLDDATKDAIKSQTGLDDFSNEFTIYGICKLCKNKIIRR